MKHILLFGAGKSSAALIDYLKNVSTEYTWQVTVADSDLNMAQSKVGEHSLVKAIKINIRNAAKRKALIQSADVVISLMPPDLHYLIAVTCLSYSKHLLTASYITDNIKKLSSKIKDKQILFLYEMGLDPGIDHMSAMQLIHRVKALDGTITSFKSHCGGLVAPESDNNPWHYKISWNPKNIILAGKSGATFKLDGEIKHVPYEELFATKRSVKIDGNPPFAWYPNRNSLSYADIYKLNDASTFIRTTLRHPNFCFGWKNIIDLKLTDETPQYETDGLTVAAFFKQHFDKYGFSEWLSEMLNTKLNYAKGLMENLMDIIESEEKHPNGDDTLMLVNENGELNSIEVDSLKEITAAEVALKMSEANLSLKQLFFFGLDSDELINKGLCSAADILQHLMEKTLLLAPEDKDMVVMIHELEYEAEGYTTALKSSLVVKGENSTKTAMAKTVGLPLGIAAKLILEGKIEETGLHIPVISSIYTPVLKELEEFGIKFKESIEP